MSKPLVWVLSHLRTSPGTRITMDLMQRAGLEVEHRDPNSLHLTLLDEGVGLKASTSPVIDRPTLVYTRLGSSAPARALDVLRQLELMGLRCVNSAESLERCRDKFRSMQLLVDAGVPVPPSVLVAPGVAFDSLVERLGEPPYIVKLPVGTKGQGVSIVDSARSLRSVLDVLASLDQRILVQRFIREASGTDVRVMVFDGEAKFAVRRTARGDEFRSNVHLGGVDTREVLTSERKAVAEAAVKAHGLLVGGVDLLEGADGPLVAEVNGSPGLAGPFNQFGDELADVFAVFIHNVLAHGGDA